MMSLFDVIKYPISDPPAKEELCTLPAEIIRKFLIFNGWESLSTSCYSLPYTINAYFAFMEKNTTTINVSKLRKIIKEYDEPV